MSTSLFRQQAISNIELWADRLLAQADGILPSQGLTADEARQLAEQVGQRLRCMSAEERKAALVRTAVAIADLESLCAELSSLRDEVGDEIQRLGRHSAAAAAYVRGYGRSRPATRPR